jgi:hypothetical protein
VERRSSLSDNIAEHLRRPRIWARIHGSTGAWKERQRDEFWTDEAGIPADHSDGQCSFFSWLTLWTNRRLASFLTAIRISQVSFILLATGMRSLHSRPDTYTGCPFLALWHRVKSHRRIKPDEALNMQNSFSATLTIILHTRPLLPKAHIRTHLTSQPEALPAPQDDPSPLYTYPAICPTFLPRHHYFTDLTTKDNNNNKTHECHHQSP